VLKKVGEVGGWVVEVDRSLWVEGDGKGGWNLI